jgi:hypothetical protein
MTNHSKLFLSLSLLLTASFTSLNAITIVGPGEPPGDDRAFAGTAGFTFTVDSAYTVTELGAWDKGEDGFTGDVTVGLWADDATPTLLASVTFDTNNTGTLVDQTRFLALGAGNEVALAPSTDYVLAAYFASGPTFKDDAPAGSVDTYFTSGFNFGEGRFNTTNTGLNFPSSDTGGEEFFAANMTLIPEPAASALILAALGLLMIRRRRS